MSAESSTAPMTLITTNSTNSANPTNTSPPTQTESAQTESAQTESTTTATTTATATATIEPVKVDTSAWYSPFSWFYGSTAAETSTSETTTKTIAESASVVVAEATKSIVVDLNPIISFDAPIQKIETVDSQKIESTCESISQIKPDEKSIEQSDVKPDEKTEVISFVQSVPIVQTPVTAPSLLIKIDLNNELPITTQTTQTTQTTHPDHQTQNQSDTVIEFQPTFSANAYSQPDTVIDSRPDTVIDSVIPCVQNNKDKDETDGTEAHKTIELEATSNKKRRHSEELTQPKLRRENPDEDVAMLAKKLMGMESENKSVNQENVKLLRTVNHLRLLLKQSQDKYEVKTIKMFAAQVALEKEIQSQKEKLQSFEKQVNHMNKTGQQKKVARKQQEVIRDIRNQQKTKFNAIVY